MDGLQGGTAQAATREECLERVVALAKELGETDTSFLIEEEPVALVGVSEAAQLLGWDRRKVAVYAARGQFPSPVAHLAGGKVWRRADIEEYRASRAESSRRAMHAKGAS